MTTNPNKCSSFSSSSETRPWLTLWKIDGLLGIYCQDETKLLPQIDWKVATGFPIRSELIRHMNGKRCQFVYNNEWITWNSHSCCFPSTGPPLSRFSDGFLRWSSWGMLQDQNSLKLFYSGYLLILQPSLVPALLPEAALPRGQNNRAGGY